MLICVSLVLGGHRYQVGSQVEHRCSTSPHGENVSAISALEPPGISRALLPSRPERLVRERGDECPERGLHDEEP